MQPRPPLSPLFYSSRPSQIEKERRETAQRDNANLLHKMQHIMVTHGYVDQHHTYQHHSLNASKRQREHQQVTQENMVQKTCGIGYKNLRKEL